MNNHEEQVAEEVGAIILNKLQKKAAFHLFMNACTVAMLPVDKINRAGKAENVLTELAKLANFALMECKKNGLDLQEIAHAHMGMMASDPLASFTGTMQ